MTAAAMGEFWLASTEHETWASPRHCTITQRADGPWPDRETYVALLDPPVIAPGGSRAVWLVRPRHEGTTIVPPSSWPVYVHIARPVTGEELPAWVTPDDLVVEAWCELYRDQREASAAMRASWR